MIFHWPQITYLLLIFFSLGISIEKHGKPRTGKSSFWPEASAAAFVLFLLYKGGFFGAAS